MQPPLDEATRQELADRKARAMLAHVRRDLATDGQTLLPAEVEAMVADLAGQLLDVPDDALSGGLV